MRGRKKLLDYSNLNTLVRLNCFLATNDLAKAIDNKTQVDMAILDFSKAFDKDRLKHWQVRLLLNTRQSTRMA